MGNIFSVIGALMLLGIASLGINTMLVDKTSTMLEAEASLNAISIAQSMIDEIETKSYDAATANGTRIFDSTLFTAPNALGPSNTEQSNVLLPDTSSPFKSDKYYNDMDDYHKYTRIVSTPVMGKFTVLDTVYYGTEANPDTKSNIQTNYKKIIVTVTHANMSYPLKLSDIVVYRKYF